MVLQNVIIGIVAIIIGAVIFDVQLKRLRKKEADEKGYILDLLISGIGCVIIGIIFIIGSFSISTSPINNKIDIPDIILGMVMIVSGTSIAITQIKALKAGKHEPGDFIVRLLISGIGCAICGIIMAIKSC